MWVVSNMMINWINWVGKTNMYAKKWFDYFSTPIVVASKTDWQKTDIFDLKDYNKMKTDINIVLNQLGIQPLAISYLNHQNLTQTKYNGINSKIREYQAWLGNKQSEYKICGLATVGGELSL